LSKVTILDRTNNVVASLGNGEYSNKDWSTVRNQGPGTFVPGRFVCPHGACFNYEGNIFVVEWVECGRVTKLRKVACARLWPVVSSECLSQIRQSMIKVLDMLCTSGFPGESS